MGSLLCILKTMKKIFLISLIIIVLGGAVYFFWPFFKSLFTESGIQNQSNFQPTNEQGGSTNVLVSRPIFDYWFKGDEIYYLTLEGEFFRISPTGTHRRIDFPPIIDRSFLKPSFDGKLALVAFGNKDNVVLSVFDSETNSWLLVDEAVISAAWHPSQNQIVYLKSGSDSSSLKILNLANKQTVEVTKLNIEDVALEWLTPDEIYIFGKPSSLAASSLWALNVSKKTLRAVIKDEFGLMTLWGGDGKRALKFNTRGGESRLAFIDSNNKILAPVPLAITLPSKCSFEGVLLYCAIPKVIPSQTVLPDDYLKLKFYSQDDFLVWNTETGEIKTVFETTDAFFDAQELRKKDNKLFFINRYDRNLYSLEIKNP